MYFRTIYWPLGFPMQALVCPLTCRYDWENDDEFWYGKDADEYNDPFYYDDGEANKLVNVKGDYIEKTSRSKKKKAK